MEKLEAAHKRLPAGSVKALIGTSGNHANPRGRLYKLVKYALLVMLSGAAASILVDALGAGNSVVSVAMPVACMAAASAILRQLPRIKSHRRRLLNLVESLNYVGIIAAVLASGGTIQKAIEISASDASCAYNRRLRGALILTRNGVAPEHALLSSFSVDPVFKDVLPFLSETTASDPKQLIVAWRREARSATSMVEDISSIFTALSSILPIISSIIIAILGRDASLFFVILPLQLLIYGVIRWWLRNVTITLC